MNDLYLEHAASLFAHARVGPDMCAATVLGVFVVSAFDTFCAVEGPLEYNSDVSLWFTGSNFFGYRNCKNPELKKTSFLSKRMPSQKRPKGYVFALLKPAICFNFERTQHSPLTARYVTVALSPQCGVCGHCGVQ